MKKVILLIIVVNFSIISFGQTQERTVNKIYLQAGVGGSSYNGLSGGVGIQAMFKKNWVGSFTYQNLTTDPKNVPSDYRPGSTTVFFLTFDDTPTVETSVYSLTTGKYFKVGRTAWFSTEAGLSYVKGQKVNYTRNVADASGWNLLIFGAEPSNYTTTIENKAAVGGVVKADFTWAFAPVAALGAGVYTNLNSIQSTVGFEIKVSIGWMNIKKRH